MRLPHSCSRNLSFRIVSVTTFMACIAVLTFSAQAPAQQLSCSPASLKFGMVTIGQSEVQLVSLSNTGASGMTVSSISVTGSEFSISGVTLPLALSPGESVNVGVTFAPTATGRTQAVITFSSSSSPSLQLDISGNGVKSESLSAAPASLSFGQVAVGSTESLSVVLTNARSSSDTLTAFQTSGSGFTVSGPAMPAVLYAGQTITLKVNFIPTAAGVVDGAVFISGPNLNIPLSGTGTTTKAVGQLSITPTALSFGNVDVGSATTQPSSITATGGSVTISSASSSNSQYSIARRFR